MPSEGAPKGSDTHRAERSRLIRDTILSPRRSKEKKVRPCRILVTAPHAATDKTDMHADDLRDPLSGRIARRVAKTLSVQVIVAKQHRRVWDQNRIEGLAEADDMAKPLVRFFGSGKKEVLLLDIHSFDTKSRPRRWGRGINVIVVRGEKEVGKKASQFADAIDRHAKGRLPLTKVVTMSAYPTHARDDSSNAVSEYALRNGAWALLVEVPVRRKRGDRSSTRKKRCAVDSCWEVDGPGDDRTPWQFVADSIARAGLEVARPRTPCP